MCVCRRVNQYRFSAKIHMRCFLKSHNTLLAEHLRFIMKQCSNHIFDHLNFTSGVNLPPNVMSNQKLHQEWRWTWTIWMFPKIVVPPNHHFNRVFHYKPSILGYPYFWKHPYVWAAGLAFSLWESGNWLARYLTFREGRIIGRQGPTKACLRVSEITSPNPRYLEN